MSDTKTVVRLSVPATLAAQAEGTALAAHRQAGRVFRGLLAGRKISRDDAGHGTYERAVIGLARRDAINTLDTITGRPTGRGVTAEDRIGWYLATGDDDLAGE
jgi:hypothetical protein